MNNEGSAKTGDNEENRENDGNPRRPIIEDKQKETEDEITMAISYKDLCDSMARFGGYLQMERIAKNVIREEIIHGARGKKGLRTYKDLIDFMRDEWPNNAITLDIQTKLMDEKKKSNETYLEFFYRMRGIGDAKLEEAAMIKFIVDGLTDDLTSKAGLYEAKNYAGLKDKLIIKDMTAAYTTNEEKRVTKTTPQNGGRNNSTKPTPSGDRVVSKKCFNCSITEHQAFECPDKTKGKKCYNCDAFGHISKDCRKPRTEKDVNKTKPAPMLMMNENSDPNMIIEVVINHQKTNALLDTGSKFTVMDANLFKQLGLKRRSTNTVAIKGFGCPESDKIESEYSNAYRSLRIR